MFFIVIHWSQSFQFWAKCYHLPTGFHTKPTWNWIQTMLFVFRFAWDQRVIPWDEISQQCEFVVDYAIKRSQGCTPVHRIISNHLDPVCMYVGVCVGLCVSVSEGVILLLVFDLGFELSKRCIWFGVVYTPLPCGIFHTPNGHFTAAWVYVSRNNGSAILSRHWFDMWSRLPQALCTTRTWPSVVREYFSNEDIRNKN